MSTMSLIKKNEFLNSIKEGTHKALEDNASIKQVIKIIDRNLNNTDDWNVFEEAFNNADKDFLKISKQVSTQRFHRKRPKTLCVSEVKSYHQKKLHPCLIYLRGV